MRRGVHLYFADLYDELGCIYERAGHLARAQRYWDKALFHENAVGPEPDDPEPLSAAAALPVPAPPPVDALAPSAGRLARRFRRRLALAH